MSCLFCKIIAGEIPSNKIHEDEDFLAFHDINPQAPVHALVIPKAHVVDFRELSGEMMAKMTPFIQETAKKLGIHDEGFRIVNNIGTNGGQEVFHIHFHLIGGAKLRWGNFV